MAEKRREAKGKGKKERYTHLNAEFQRIARRDKKAFLSGQSKEIAGVQPRWSQGFRRGEGFGDHQETIEQLSIN